MPTLLKIIRKITILSAMMFFSNYPGLIAQQFNIETFTTKEGLSHNDVRSIASDSAGFLWVATWDGLCRYDGYSFKNYYHNNEDSLSLPHFSVRKILIDGGNNMWLLFDNYHIALYNRDKDNFILIDKLYGNMPDVYNNMGLDESGNLWLSVTGMVYRFDFKANKFSEYELLGSDGKQIKQFKKSFEYDISAKDSNRFWLVDELIMEFEKTTGNKYILKKEYSIEPRKLISGTDFLYDFWFRLYKSESGKKWVFSNSGLFLLDEKRNIFREFHDKIPLNEFKGSDFFSWSWPDEGIFIFDSENGKLTNIPQSFCQLTKWIFCQNKSLIWFSNISRTGASLGLNKVIFTPDYFRKYPLPDAKNDLAAVYSITRDKFNRTWVGLRGDPPLIEITPDMKTRQHKVPEYLPLKNGALRSLTKTPDGIWVGFFQNLLLFYDFKTGSFVKYKTGALYFRPVTIDKNGDLYLLGENMKIIHFSPLTREIKKVVKSLVEFPVYKIVVDEGGIVWTGMNNSTIQQYNPVNDEKKVFKVSKEAYNIEDICPGENGDLWLATLGAGVCRLNPASGGKMFYTTANGLSNNITYSLLKDSEGNIWVSTNSGISRINPKTGIIRRFGINEGLNITEFNSGASYKDESGEFLMGGMGGLVGFYPEKVNKDEVVTGNQKIIITDFRVSGVSRLYKNSTNKSDTLFLENGEDDFGVYFSSTDFLNSENTVYRYKLEGVNANWTEADSRNRNVSYANLTPGWYNYVLQATDRLGNWSMSKNIVVRVTPLFYQSKLFRIGSAFLALAIIISIIIIYIRQIKHKEAQKQDALKLQSLQGQMNPHFIFNSLNSINYFISKNDPLSANRYIADFSKLIRSILYNFNSDFIPLEKEVESLEDYLKIEHLRFGNKFNYKLFISPEIQSGEFKVSPGLVQPFVENAIWHGVRGLRNRKGNVSISFNTDHKKLICVIEDDGIGRSMSEGLKSKTDRKASKGINLVTERLRILNNLQKNNYNVTISDLSPGKQEPGTRVVIDIPVKKP